MQMKNSLLAPLILGGAVVVAVGAYAGTRMNAWQDYADVVSVVPAFDNQQTAREECNDEAVTQQVPIKDEKRVAGTAIGAVIGGVLGNQVGSGDGKKLATAAGDVAGGYAGSKTQKRLQEGNTETVVEHRWKAFYDNQKVPGGFDVTYLLDGTQGIVRMDHDPGKRIPLENGELDLSRT